ncbi:unnamed protein product [Candidula unifasciata]|uniref:Selenoprotein S n=1 Tax=Candidula unifasciata TaxID=100452 RepID=A0A8S3YG25_9EUPU|nr:unnamed protein product [Candidula unifasciata]
MLQNHPSITSPTVAEPAIHHFTHLTGVLQLYGWTILFVVVAVLYIGSKVKPWLQNYTQHNVTSSYKKMDTGAVQDRLEAMERARLRMQAQHDEEARKFAERQKELLVEVRLVKGKKSKETDCWQTDCYLRVFPLQPEQLPKPATAKSQPKKPLKPAYNPLMGGGSSAACYRPSRRGGPSAGG